LALFKSLIAVLTP